MPKDFITVMSCDICHRSPGPEEADDNGNPRSAKWTEYHRDSFRLRLIQEDVDWEPVQPEPPFVIVICPECWPVFWNAIHLEIPLSDALRKRSARKPKKQTI